MSVMDSVVLPAHVNLRWSERSLPKFDAESVTLDMRGVHRVDRQAGWMLTAGLLRAKPAQLRVHPPRRRATEILDQSGLSFAFAHGIRPDFVGTGPDNLDRWQTSWTYRRGPLQLGLFPEHEDGPGRQLPMFRRRLVPKVDEESRVVAFVNPHIGSRPGEPLSVARAMGQWVRGLPKLARARPSFMRLLTQIIDELVWNVGDHAGPNAKSTILVNSSRGNSNSCRYRVHIAVIDDGPGIVETARPKVPAIKDSNAILEALLRGGAFPNSGRGHGLPSVVRAVGEAPEGTLRVYSGRHCARVDGTRLSLSESGFDAGTLIMIALDVPSDAW